MNEASPNSSIEHKQRQTHLDVLKGLLILIVMLGHNKLFTDSFQSWQAFNLIYAFQVQSFFFISALTNRRPISVDGLWKRFKSYLYPQLIFFSLFSIFYYNFQRESPNFHFGNWLFALISGNSQSSRAYSGVAYLWFLPALFGFYFVISVYNCLKNTYLKIACAAGLFLLSLYLFSLNLPMSRAPFGLATAIYMVPIAILVRYIYDRYALSWITILGSLIVVCVFCQTIAGATAEIGYPKIFNRPERSFIIIDILFMMGCFFLLNRASITLATNKFLAYLGRNTLQIYLSHQIFHILIINFFILRKGLINESTNLFTQRLVSLIVFIVVVLLSTGVVWLSKRRPVCWLFFPSKNPPQSQSAA